MLRRLLSSLRARPAQTSKSQAPRPARSGHVEPLFAMINKMYREPPFDRPERLEALSAALQAMGKALQPNVRGSHALFADDLAVWFRTLGFLDEPEFVAACGEHAADPVIRARIWRVYTLCWAARSCLGVEGDYVDLGCYDGKTVEIIARYVGFATQRRRYFAYDLFDEPPAEARKAGHGPQLYAEVCARLSPLGEFRVVRGHLPDTLAAEAPRRIAFVQLDLNVAEAEIGCLERVFDRIVPGGMLVLDDYGFVRYRESQERERDFFAARAVPVLELPTGQGLVIKR